MNQLVIIGNGIAGITTTRHVRQQDDRVRITVISAESDHFYSRTALMYIYMGHMTYAHTKPYEDWFWSKNRIELVRGYVEHVDTAKNRIRLTDGTELSYDALVIATGSVPATLNAPGITAKGVQSFYGLPDLASMEQYTQGIDRAVVVGGGLIGIELTEMLRSRHIAVTMLVRDKTYWQSTLPAEEGQLIERHIREHGVDLRLTSELHEIQADESGRVRAVVTTDGQTIPCQFVGLGIGVTPNVNFLRSSGLDLAKGVLVNEYFETSVSNVYAVGDCNEFRSTIVGTDGAPRKTIEQIWYTGRMHGETLAQTLCGKRTMYQPGPFFNSAKFFDIEYQTYGTLNTTLAEGEATHYWEHPAGRQCLRLNYRADDRRVVGVHALGLRLRHAVIDRWLQERRSLDYVLNHIRQADFNPEFSDTYADALTGNGPVRTSWLRRLFSSSTH